MKGEMSNTLNMCFNFTINNIFYGCFYCFTYFLRKNWNDFVENVRAVIITTLQTTAKDHTLALKEHSTEIDALYNKIKELESRIEGQEQYSRRSSLRFHNIKVSVDERGNVKHPVYTDELYG
jgi:hypothetical protein